MSPAFLACEQAEELTCKRELSLSCDFFLFIPKKQKNLKKPWGGQQGFGPASFTVQILHHHRSLQGDQRQSTGSGQYHNGGDQR